MVTGLIILGKSEIRENDETISNILQCTSCVTTERAFVRVRDDKFNSQDHFKFSTEKKLQ